MDKPDYLNLIRNARVYDVAEKTPLELAKNLSRRLGNRILMKREDLQPVFSFKLRGAYNKISGLSADELSRGVMCSSAGNHAQGVALAAQRKGIRAVIVMPVTTPTIKVDAVVALGGEVLLHGDTYDDAYAHARELSTTENSDLHVTPGSGRARHVASTVGEPPIVSPRGGDATASVTQLGDNRCR